MIFFLKITPFFETVINRKQTTNVYFFWFSAYHDSCSCSGTSICMSKMWRRIYSSPSARFSYEKVSIGTWYPFPVSGLCRTFGFDFSRQNARRKQQQMPLPQETCHRIYSSPSARWKCVNKRLKSVSGLSVSNFRFWFFSSKSTKKNKQTANCHSLKKPVIEPPSRSLCIETKKLERSF